MDLIDQVRSQATVLCEVAEQLIEEAASVLVPSHLMSNDALVLDQPIPLASLIDGLGEDHVPVHTHPLSVSPMPMFRRQPDSWQGTLRR
ncbi:hypothetical protein [Streptomyces sp. NPDC005148]